MKKGQKVYVIDKDMYLEAIDDDNTLQIINEKPKDDDEDILFIFSSMINPISGVKQAEQQ